MKRFHWFEISLITIIMAVHLYAAFSAPHNFSMRWFTRDDAYYYFKVAQNITEGHGSSFDGINATNGYHPLWMAICIPIFSLARFDLILPLRILLVVMAAMGTFGYNFQTIFPLVNEYVLHGGAPGLSLLLALSAVGSVMAGLFAAYAGKPSQRRLLVSAGVFTILLFLLGLSHWRPVTWTLAFLIGVASIIFMTSANTRLQLVVSGEMRGRVMGMYALLFVGTTPIGSLLVGTLAEKNGVPLMVLEMAAVCAVGVLAAVWFALRRRAAPLAHPVETAEK